MTLQVQLNRPVVGLAQWLAVPGGARENVDAAFGLMDAMDPACNLIVLPEFWTCGFDPESFVEDVRRTAVTLDGPLVRKLCDWARAHGVYLVPGTLSEKDGDRIFNTTLLIGPNGDILARHRKAHLWGLEDTVMTAGDRATICKGTDFGDIGLSICFDGDFPETARAMRKGGARLVINPSAYFLPFDTWWETLFPAHALLNGQWWIMSNQAGSHGSVTLFGKSQVISPAGKIVASATGAAMGENPKPETLVFEIDFDSVSTEEANARVLFSERRQLELRTFQAREVAGTDS
ncbi:MAG: carbon-nitrogen hydrolase family protein [Novosphingobium sp.]|nr:carbon-nitrogen hydrolase family protein [Novosphingobium sp.]